MILGFTGTRAGMTPAQHESVRSLITTHSPEEVHHGVCVGGDTEFYFDCHELLGEFHGVLWPGLNSRGEAPTTSHEAMELAWRRGDTILTPAYYPVRDEKIVKVSERMIAAPQQEKMVMRGSGTWLTVRIARRHGRTIDLVYPDGRIVTETPTLL